MPAFEVDPEELTHFCRLSFENQLVGQTRFVPHSCSHTATPLPILSSCAPRVSALGPTFASLSGNSDRCVGLRRELGCPVRLAEMGRGSHHLLENPGPFGGSALVGNAIGILGAELLRAQPAHALAPRHSPWDMSACPHLSNTRFLTRSPASLA